MLLRSFGKILSHLFTESELDKLANSSRMTFLKTQSSDSAISPGRELYETIIANCCKFFFSDYVLNMARVSSHPVHMTADAPSSFIPFCAFDGELDRHGTLLANFSVPFCSTFAPTIIEGQLCYALNITKIGLIKEALFFIDTNLERSVHASQQNSKKSGALRLKQGLGEKSQLAKIHIDTLEPFTSETFASYALTSLKKMTSTQNFEEMSDKDKGCRMEARGDCERKMLVQKVSEMCQCVPFSLLEGWPNSSSNTQVKPIHLLSRLF